MKSACLLALPGQHDQSSEQFLSLANNVYLVGDWINLTIEKAITTDPPERSEESTINWNKERRELSVNKVIVKRFRVPAQNQELILNAFEEEGWPYRIDDPLHPVDDIDPKHRLHAAINCLNRNRKSNVIRFCGDGNGNGVCWEFTPA